MNTLLQDITYALRMLRKSPGFSAIAIATLALGIGANTTIFSVVHAVLLKPLPFHQPDRLVELWETEVTAGNFPLADQDFVDWRARNHTFDDMAAFTWRQLSNVSGAGASEQIALVQTQANFFSVLGVSPQLGRTFAAGEDAKGRNHVVVLSDAFWKTHFGGRADAIDKTIELNSETYTVVGVMPAWYSVPATADVWIPIDWTPAALRGRDSHYLRALGRIKNGVTIEQARADLGALSARIAKDFPKTNTDETAIVIPMQTELTGDSKTPLWTMFGAVGLVLLIACANVANLLLARSIGRRREMAVRGAMGASHGRLVRQLLTESVILSLAGGAVGALLAYNAVDILGSLKGAAIVPPNPVQLDTSVLLFCIAVSSAVGILFGLAPAFQISNLDLTEELKSRAVGAVAGGARSAFLRDALVAVEIALSLALLAGAGLLLRTFANLRGMKLGVRTDHVLIGSVMVPEKNYATFDQGNEFSQRFLDKLKHAPGIRDAAFNWIPPLTAGTNGYVTVEGQPEDFRGSPLVAENAVTPGYFHTMGVPLLEGRDLSDEDLQDAAGMLRDITPLYKANQIEAAQALERKFTTSAVISKGMAEHFWPNQDAIGKIFRIGAGPCRVVGVVADVRNNGFRDPAMLAAYVPLGIDFGYGAFDLFFSVLTSGPPQSVESTIRSELKSMDSTLALSDVQTIPQLVAGNMADTNDETLLLGTLAALAMLLAAVGTYGVMSYVVSQRTNEIGIRVALGAQSTDILGLVLKQGMVVVAIGIGLGLVATLSAARLIRDLLVGVAPFDPLTYGCVAALLAGVALAACYIPARRAMRVDPMVALRYE
ncbi:MAG: ABC transporter permease [Candidatus Acidiferrales bacterium]